ncbi:hypothetical protein KGF54_002913 [Candida jiufengensis]|uniref:uncharacterized protein n=1 Tax=Candida jiufengensis TaxID=497108 RepID=UPI0022251D86|nr:uncharacterized protein KGF54_002913 [Candida jiufengensis]KAI5953541.1 hypothetical protein KGF54_002913 [Candida jiufengensis]
MSFEVLILPTSWFRNPKTDLSNLRYLINKGYNKPRKTFGIIETLRIISTDSFFDDLAVLPNDQLNFFLLLGTEEKFQNLENNGIYRDFKDEDVQNAFGCDIPKEYRSLFPLSDLPNAKIKIVDSDFKLDDSYLKRVIASTGLRSYDKVSKPGEKDVILTTYCSFLSHAASDFLDFLISNCILNPKIFKALYSEPLSDFKTIVIHADCIIEHNLIDYYTGKCKFFKSNKPDISIASAAGGYKQVIASRNFNIGFLYRRIDV